MAGRIRDEDVRAVRDASPIADVIGEYLQLRSAGGGNLKGLCPFHDEKSPSFNVTPSRGMYYCFGCGEGGDVITFITKVEGLAFNEAVERLAKRARIELRYAEGGYTKRAVSSERARLLEANQAAAQFYREQLATPGARVGRELLAGRGFDQSAAEKFRIGYAPEGWDNLIRHLLARGFTERELMSAGLASQGQRGLIDRFRHRLMWPIADVGGEIIGFGGRRLSEDKNSPKYLNTPETPLYKKSSVLYGLDLARREIVSQQKAVVVEGYTDVMACHLAGEGTAIATCGTSFGEEHIKILRRLTGDRNQFLSAKIVFTFDGDSAGQKAALRVFTEDQRFVTQTYVAVQPEGLDPCDLRMARGDAAVRDLVDSRVQLFEFVIRARLAEHDLNTPEGQVQALRAAAPVVAGIRDDALRQGYALRLSGWLGLDEQIVRAEVRRAAPRRERAAVTSGSGASGLGASGLGASGSGSSGPYGAAAGSYGPSGSYGSSAGAYGPSGSYGPSVAQQRPGAAGPRNSGSGAAHSGAGPQIVASSQIAAGPNAAAPHPATPHPAASPVVEVPPRDRYRQREALKIALQYPSAAGALFDDLELEEFTLPGHALVRQAIAAAGGCAAVRSAEEFREKVMAAAADDRVRGMIRELLVEPLQVRRSAKNRDQVEQHYVETCMSSVRLSAVERRISLLRAQMLRAGAAGDPDAQAALFARLQQYQQYAAQLKSRYGL
jgi:DNA primase